MNSHELRDFYCLYKSQWLSGTSISSWAPMNQLLLYLLSLKATIFLHLVGGLVAINFLFPQKLGMSNHPNWRTHIFQRGGQKPPTSHDFFLWFSLVVRWFSDGNQWKPLPWFSYEWTRQALRGVGGLILNAEGQRFCNELGRRWAAPILCFYITQVIDFRKISMD